MDIIISRDCPELEDSCFDKLVGRGIFDNLSVKSLCVWQEQHLQELGCDRGDLNSIYNVIAGILHLGACLQTNKDDKIKRVF
eukprot:573171-Amphidinium_carterae.1